MSAPTAASIKSTLEDALPADFKDDQGDVTSEQSEWLLALADAMHDAWSSWESGLIGGGLEVCGSGLGDNWTGTGNGGGFTEDPVMAWSSTPSFGKTKELTELDDALSDYTEAEFTDWAISYSFSGAAYEGSSTATTNNSGTFNAEAIGTEVLANIGSGTFPGSIKSGVLTELETQGWKPADADIGKWLDAFDQMIQTEFQNWLEQATWVNNSVTGPSAAGDGSGCGTSNNDGDVV